MEKNLIFPLSCELTVSNVFEEKINIVLYEGITTFIGPNGSGKTQTQKRLRDYLKSKYGNNHVRYLSSNRIGAMEQYRSKINQYNYSSANYQVGNRETKTHRHDIETSEGDFFTMDERKDVYIKISERLSVLFKRQIFLRWDSGNMKVFFEKDDGRGEYSVVAEASGLINVISILAALYDEEILFLLIDEPEVSLHPQLQAFLLREMKAAVKEYGKTIVLSTHATDFISLNTIEDISHFVFFSENNLPRQVDSSIPEFKSKKLGDFIQRLGHSYKNGFFAKRILLIEGASDLVLCNYLSDRLGYNIDVSGTQIVPTDGKGQFPAAVKLFRIINKDVAILTDLDGFIDDNSIVELFVQSAKAKEIASKHAANSVSDMVRNVKTKISDMIIKHIDDMREVYEKHPYWINKKEDDDETKTAKRAMVGMLFCVEDNEISKWQDAEEWKNTKIQIDTVISVLGELGCFVLKKGAIESYYHYVSNNTCVEKPSAAIEEVSNLDGVDFEKIKEYYSDIVTALEFVSIADEIDESLAVKKELLSELALVLGLVKYDKDEKAMYAAIKQAKNNADSLFEYQIIAEEYKKGVEVNIKSNILQVTGFPFKIFVGDNVNAVVEDKIRNRMVTVGR